MLNFWLIFALCSVLASQRILDSGRFRAAIVFGNRRQRQQQLLWPSSVASKCVGIVFARIL